MVQYLRLHLHIDFVKHNMRKRRKKETISVTDNIVPTTVKSQKRTFFGERPQNKFHRLMDSTGW